MICLAAFVGVGGILVLVGRHEARHDTRIIVDLKARGLRVESAGKATLEVPFDHIVGIQLAFLYRWFRSMGDDGDSFFGAYQVNLVYDDAAEGLQRRTISDASTKAPSARVAVELGRLLGVDVLDHATCEDVRQRKNNARCEDWRDAAIP